MTSPLVFFISAHTEPILPAPDQKHGSATQIVLTEAPSRENAETWARQYVQKMLLDLFPEQKLSELKIIPVHDAIFTHEGSEKIDWTTFPAKAMSARERHSSGFHYSAETYLKLDSNKPRKTPLPADWDDLDACKERMIGHAEKFNWDKNKQFYYLAYSDTDAFVIKSVNIFTSAIPFIKNTIDTPYSESNITTTTWPGVREYEN